MRHVLLLTLFACSSDPPDPTAAVSRLFTDAKVEGAFVLLAPDGAETIVNPTLAGTRFSPCSTFKLPNTLIGLETGVIPDESFTLQPPKEKQRREAWNRAHDLPSAMRHSVVWYYQEVARRVGLAREKEYVEKFDYGNEQVGAKVDAFWLPGPDGPLRISAREQAAFLRRLHEGKLPGVSDKSRAILEKIIILDDEDGRVLRGKTGTGYEDEKVIAWLVGWVTKGDQVHYYAMFLRAPAADGDRVMELRGKLADDVLAALGI